MADPIGPGSYSSKKKVRQPSKIKGGLLTLSPLAMVPGLSEDFWTEAGFSLDLEAPWNVNDTLTPSPDSVLDTCRTNDRMVVSACCRFKSYSPASGQPRASDVTTLALPQFLHYRAVLDL